MKSRFAAVGLLLAVLLTGCNSQDTQSDASPAVPETAALPDAEAPETFAEAQASASGLIYYVTDHGTASLSETSSFLADITDAGYTLETDALHAVPIDADAVILNAPDEDITLEELEILDSYMDEGGHVLLLIPADEREVRYKYLERFLEEYCILMDYDLLTETEEAYMLDGEAEFLQIMEVNAPDGMSQPAAGIPVYQHHARSFHFTFGNNYSAIKQDAMLETQSTALGTPFGGTEDDPESHENEQLMTMLFSRNDQRRNSTIVAAGSSDFLLNEHYNKDSSSQMKKWVFATLAWFTAFLS